MVMVPDNGGLIGNKYRLEQRLACGGMSELWSALHVELGCLVAVKFGRSTPGPDAQSEVRFRREAQTLARLRCPHFVHVYDFGIESGRPYIVMELLEGETLRDRIERDGRCSLMAARTIALQTAQALAVIHRAGLVHRDVKPSNIFLERSGDREITKLLDFGIVKDQHREAEITTSGAIVGSPAFMSPEQARGLEVDHRSDLWSFGAVLFTMVTGRDPFAASSIPDVLNQICHGDMLPATQANPELPPDLDRFFSRALSRNRTVRFQTAQDLAEEFCKAIRSRLTHEPAHPSPAPRRQSPGDYDLVRTSATQDLQPSEVVASRRKPSRPSAVKWALTGASVVALCGVSMALARDRVSPTPQPGFPPDEASVAMAAPTRVVSVPPIPAPIGPSTASASAAASASTPPSRPVASRARLPAPARGAPVNQTGSPAVRAFPSSGPALDPVFGLPLAHPASNDEKVLADTPAGSLADR
jgi:serine/threonine-protein kinase